MTVETIVADLERYARDLYLRRDDYTGDDPTTVAYLAAAHQTALRALAIARGNTP